MKQHAENYIEAWKRRGYSDDIPDEVPQRLMWLRKAPSYKAVCLAILKNSPGDLNARLVVSAWYSELKRVELTARGALDADQEGRLRQRYFDYEPEL